MRSGSGHLGLSRPWFFPDSPPFSGGNEMPYGSATVRLYVGAVKRVALPIVALAINRADAMKSTARIDCQPNVAQLLRETTYQDLPSD
jgi:hypothetical protein